MSDHSHSGGAHDLSRGSTHYHDRLRVVQKEPLRQIQLLRSVHLPGAVSPLDSDPHLCPVWRFHHGGPHRLVVILFYH